MMIALRMPFAWLNHKLFGAKYVYTRDRDGDVRFRRVLRARWDGQPQVRSSRLMQQRAILLPGGRTEGSDYTRDWRPLFQTKAEAVVAITKAQAVIAALDDRTYLWTLCGPGDEIPICPECGGVSQPVNGKSFSVWRQCHACGFVWEWQLDH